MKKNNKGMTVEELQKALDIEIRPAEELKCPAAHPERFDFFMKYAVKKKYRNSSRGHK